jgi:hypothetical protein
MVLHFELTAPDPTMAVSIPLQVLVDGVPAEFAVIDSTTQAGGDFDLFSLADARTADVPPGHIMGGYVDYEPGYGSGTLLLGSVELLNPPQFSPHIITVTPVEIPPGDNTPMAVKGVTREGWALNVETCIICLPGDLNNDRTVNAADILTAIYSAFKCGICYPYPSHAAADMDCSGSFTAVDIIALINYVFKSGVAPCDVESECTISINQGDGWSCP